MLAGLKELKNWVTEYCNPTLNTGGEDYHQIEYSQRHLHTPQSPKPLTYEEEARIKTVKFH